MNIAIIVPTLAMGGAERLAVLQAKCFKERAHNATLITLSAGEDFYPPPDGVKRIKLNLPDTPFYKNPLAPFKRISAVRAALSDIKADIVISHMSTLACYGAYTAGVPFIFAEHSNNYKRKLWPRKTFILRRALCAAVLSKRDDKTFTRKKIKTKIIYNPALKPVIKNDARPPFYHGKTALFAGRLVKEKGLDILLEAWNQIKDKHDFNLVIAGAGPEKRALEKIIDTKKIERVVFAGAQSDMGALYKYADIFVLPSRSEAFPLALCEAMSMGLPTVAFNCTGADVIVRDNIDGFLVRREDACAFALALKTLINDEEKRKTFGQKAAQITDRFSLEGYINAYEELIKSII